MLLIPCPWCGPRPENEFRYGGQANLTRPAASVDDATWSAYLYFRDNPRGQHQETWCHQHGCGRFFHCVRDTVTDRIADTSKIGAPKTGSR